MERKPKTPFEFAQALRSFLGHLEGTHHSPVTVKNYQSDLRSFQNFLLTGLGQRAVSLQQLTKADLDRYQGWLKAKGLKTNTVRRKIITVRRFLIYLRARKKIALDLGKRIPAPYKVERTPAVVDAIRLLDAIRNLPAATELDARNRALLWTLAETGALVSEAAKFRFDQIQKGERGPVIQIQGKNARPVPISEELFSALESVQTLATRSQSPWIFHGFNRFGSLRSAITPRGIELLVRSYAPRLGADRLVPRTFRHSIVVQWAKEGLTISEIQIRLGLRTQYAFKNYAPLIEAALTKSSS